MAELNLSTGTVEVVQEGGTRFELPLIEAQLVFDECYGKHEEHLEGLKEIQKYLVENYQVHLNLGQVDELRDEVTILYAQKKRQRREKYASMLGLPASTESTPSS